MNRWFETRRRINARLAAGLVGLVAVVFAAVRLGSEGLGAAVGVVGCLVIVVVALAMVHQLEVVEGELARGAPESDLEDVLAIANELVRPSRRVWGPRHDRLLARARKMLAERQGEPLKVGERRRLLRLARHLWNRGSAKGEATECLRQCVAALCQEEPNEEEARFLQQVRAFAGSFAHRVAAREAAGGTG